MYQYNVIHYTPTTPDPKYEAYMAQMAITCAATPAAQPAAIEPAKPAVTEPAIPAVTEPVKPTEPANPSPAPASTGLTPEQQVCLDLYNGLQTTKDPEYGEYKNKYGSLNCDVVLGDKKPVPPPPVPLTIEEKCKMYRYNVIHSTPTTPDPKYEAYMAEMAITCAAYP
jgi:hypothetical protein